MISCLADKIEFSELSGKLTKPKSLANPTVSNIISAWIKFDFNNLHEASIGYFKGK